MKIIMIIITIIKKLIMIRITIIVITIIVGLKLRAFCWN